MIVRRRWNRVEMLGLALGFFLLCNALRIAALHLTVDRTLFQLDYALPPLVLWLALRLGWRRWVAVTATLGTTVAAIASDLLGVTARLYRWDNDGLEGFLRASGDLPWHMMGPTLLAVPLAAAMASVPLTLRAGRRGGFAIWPLGLAVAGLVALDLGTGRLRSTDVLERNVLLSSGYDLLAGSGRSFLRYTLGAEEDAGTLAPRPGPSLARDLPVAQAPRGILSVAVESWGSMRDPAAAQMLPAPLLDALGDRYAVVEDTQHRFAGATLAGEIRELCGLIATGRPRGDAAAAALSRCLPARLQRAGYRTAGFHGNGGNIYDRARLYPAMGLRDAVFLSEQDDAAFRRQQCLSTAFRGVCDFHVFARALATFVGRRQFTHVMTLDSHLPFVSGAPEDCPPRFAGGVALCRYAATIRRSFAELGAAIGRSRHPPDLIVLYGDHAPPFADADASARFAQDAVPYLVLQRR